MDNLLQVTDEIQFGPKMAALNERQRLFVMYLVENPLATQTEAAIAVGYSNVADGAKVRAHRLMHSQNIMDAMHEVAGKRLWGLALKATAKMEAMLDSPDENVVTKAAMAIWDRTGFGAQQNINVNKTVTDMSGKAIMDRIRALADRVGVDQQKLLGKPAVVDAEFSEVKSDG